ncbi:MAG TPA: ComF family protein [Bacteroidetes bacterium]|nr:ComF family protein [Bacteroidota bacterium]
MVSVLARSLSRLVFPEVCLGCGVPTRGRLPVCASCLRRLPHASSEAIRAELDARGAAAQDIRHAAALWQFDAGGTVQRIQHALKYRGLPRIGAPLGELIGSSFSETASGWRPDVVAPIPLARTRQLERGYNQADGLAAGAAEALEARFDPGLMHRVRSTRSQTRLSHAARWANVQGAFTLHPDATVRGRRVLLIDDVITTGATLLAAAEPLRAAGAEVSLAALAFAP